MAEAESNISVLLWHMHVVGFSIAITCLDAHKPRHPDRTRQWFFEWLCHSMHWNANQPTFQRSKCSKHGKRISTLEGEPTCECRSPPGLTMATFHRCSKRPEDHRCSQGNESRTGKHKVLGEPTHGKLKKGKRVPVLQETLKKLGDLLQCQRKGKAPSEVPSFP